MAKKITSRPGLFGSTVHYDENGKKIGTSYSGAFKTDHYDANGHRVGSSYNGSFCNDHYDAKGHSAGRTYKGSFVSDHYDKNGHKTGSSLRGSGRKIPGLTIKYSDFRITTGQGTSCPVQSVEKASQSLLPAGSKGNQIMFSGGAR
ncbi:MAG: hypothetical protein ACI3VS_06515 [Evtepia sp.]